MDENETTNNAEETRPPETLQAAPQSEKATQPLPSEPKPAPFRMPAPRKPEDTLVRAVVAVLVLVSIVMVYLFWQRDVRLAEDYREYFADVIPPMDNLRANFDALSVKSEDVIRRSLALDTSEAFLAEKEEYLMVLAGNIKSCDTVRSRIMSMSAPFNAVKSRDGMVFFFERAKVCLVTLRSAVEKAEPADLERARNIMNELAGYKVPGFSYEE